MPPDISIIIVSWNVRELLRACLRSLERARGALGVETIVVDSASSDGSVEMLRAEFPTVRVIACERNVGFSAGNNLGIAQANGAFVLILNPDTEIAGDALQAMRDYLQAHPEVGAVAPQLLFPDGTVQPTRYRFPTLASALLDGTILEQWVPNIRVLRRYHLQDVDERVTQDVDWVMGACFMLSREALQAAGGFDEQFFMYAEETDLFKRIKAAGWRVVYLPSAVVIHHHSRSSDQVMPLRHIRFQTSRVRYFRKHHGPLPAFLLRSFILFSYELLIIEEAAKWLVGHKRPLRRERIGAYAQVLKSGLSLDRKTPAPSLGRMLFQVGESFRIRGRGLIVIPKVHFVPRRFKPFEADILVIRPDQIMQNYRAKFQVEHFIRVIGISRSSLILLIPNATKDDVPPGSEVFGNEESYERIHRWRNRP